MKDKNIELSQERKVKKPDLIKTAGALCFLFIFFIWLTYQIIIPCFYKAKTESAIKYLNIASATMLAQHYSRDVPAFSEVSVEELRIPPDSKRYYEASRLETQFQVKYAMETCDKSALDELGVTIDYPDTSLTIKEYKRKLYDLRKACF